MPEDKTPAEKAEEARAKLREFVESGPKSTPKAYSDTGPRPGVKQGGFGGGSGGVELKSILNPRAMKKGGKISSASKRADGCCSKGRTKGRMV